MARKTVVEIPWPLLGLDESMGYAKQRPGTTPSCLNVRAFDPLTGRARGASRPGLTKYSSTDMGSRIKSIRHVATSVALGGAASSAVSRAVKLVVICDDTLYTVASGTSTSVGTGFNSNSPVLYGADVFGKIYYADPVAPRYYDASANTLHDWDAGVTAGTFPSNGGAYPTLICNWRSRIVLSGLAGDRHNWFMSALGNPLDFDYGPAVTTETQAVAGNNTLAGYSPDIINALIPVNDDMLIFGCDHSIWMMRGDPMAGGRIDRVVDGIGMPWGEPWCKDPSGNIYFFSLQGGVYMMPPGGYPQEISQPIHDRLAAIPAGSNLFSLAWNHQEQGLYLFVGGLSTSANGTHYFWDSRAKGWWPMQFGPDSGLGNYDPRTVHVFDGDTAADRVLLLGSNHGFLHYVNTSADDDDATIAINSYITLGPISTGIQASAVLYELQISLGANSDQVSYAVYAGNSAEEAFNSTAKFTGTVSTAGRNSSIRDRARGEAFYIKLSSNTVNKSWTFENMTAVFKIAGRQSQRLLK